MRFYQGGAIDLNCHSLTPTTKHAIKVKVEIGGVNLLLYRHFRGKIQLDANYPCFYRESVLILHIV